MKCVAIALIAFAAGCSSSTPSGDPTSIQQFELLVPSGWTKHDMSTHSRAIAEWMPGENARKESITVIVAKRPTKIAPDELQALLTTAQERLQSGVFSTPKEIETKQGLVGFRIEGDFVPTGLAERYARIHAAILDGTSIVHVLYTAKDAEPENFDTVLDSLVRKGG